jgi:hypothetical protein
MHNRKMRCAILYILMRKYENLPPIVFVCFRIIGDKTKGTSDKSPVSNLSPFFFRCYIYYYNNCVIFCQEHIILLSEVVFLTKTIFNMMQGTVVLLRRHVSQILMQDTSMLIKVIIPDTRVKDCFALRKCFWQMLPRSNYYIRTPHVLSYSAGVLPVHV